MVENVSGDEVKIDDVNALEKEHAIVETRHDVSSKSPVGLGGMLHGIEEVEGRSVDAPVGVTEVDNGLVSRGVEVQLTEEEGHGQSGEKGNIEYAKYHLAVVPYYVISRMKDLSLKREECMDIDVNAIKRMKSMQDTYIERYGEQLVVAHSEEVQVSGDQRTHKERRKRVVIKGRKEQSIGLIDVKVDFIAELDEKGSGGWPKSATKGP